ECHPADDQMHFIGRLGESLVDGTGYVPKLPRRRFDRHEAHPHFIGHHNDTGAHVAHGSDQVRGQPRDLPIRGPPTLQIAQPNGETIEYNNLVSLCFFFKPLNQLQRYFRRRPVSVPGSLVTANALRHFSVQRFGGRDERPAASRAGKIQGPPALAGRGTADHQDETISGCPTRLAGDTETRDSPRRLTDSSSCRHRHIPRWITASTASISRWSSTKFARSSKSLSSDPV